jgi:hypothetical protein
MKKLFLIGAALTFSFLCFSQDPPTTENKKKKDWSKVKLTGRANDHFMMQFGYTGWAGKPDSINTSGFPRSFNMYVMLDMPFKSDPRFSVAAGPGIGTDNIFFEKTDVMIANHEVNTLRFKNVSDTNHFNKYKLVTAYLELPLELRFCLNPENTNKSFKVALGLKGGLLLDAHTKGKEWQDKTGKTIQGTSVPYIKKEKDKYFFNNTRFAGTFRIGYGLISAFTTYQLGAFIKDGLGPKISPWTVGLGISGL